jgi:hypothetical protein
MSVSHNAPEQRSDLDIKEKGGIPSMEQKLMEHSQALAEALKKKAMNQGATAATVSTKDVKTQIQNLMVQRGVNLWEDRTNHLWYVLTKMESPEKVTPKFVASVYQTWMRDTREGLRTKHKVESGGDLSVEQETMAFENYFKMIHLRTTKRRTCLKVLDQPPGRALLYDAGRL